MFQSPGWSNINPKIGGFPTQLPWERNSTPVGFSGNSLTQKRILYGLFKPVVISEVTLMLMRVLSRFLRNPHLIQGWDLNVIWAPHLWDLKRLQERKERKKKISHAWGEFFSGFRETSIPQQRVLQPSGVWKTKGREFNPCQPNSRRSVPSWAKKPKASICWNNFSPVAQDCQSQSVFILATISVQLLKTARVSLFLY